jgi:spore coat protein SA
MATVYHLLDEAESFSERDGGAVSRWAANVLKDGKEVIICPSFDSSWNFPMQRLYVLPHWSLTSPIHPLLYRIPFALQKVIYLRVFKPLLGRLKAGDIIYVHNRPETAAVLASIAEKYGVRIVLHMHNSHLVRANRAQLRALQNSTVIFCSRFLQREIESAFPCFFVDTHIVYNGADAAKFSYIERNPASVPTVIYTGRLVKYKGVQVLFEAMRILEGRGVSVRCVVVGNSGFGKSRPTRFARKLQRSRPANTQLVGYKSGAELAKLLQEADLFCCPSIWNDPFPLAPLEAMATGLPVVASSTGGLLEMLAHGGGTLVPPGDPAKLANALEALVTDESLRKEMSEDARKAFLEHYLWSNVRTQYENALRHLIDEWDPRTLETVSAEY